MGAISYPDADRIVAMAQTNPAEGLQQVPLSYSDAEDWRAAKSLESLAAYRYQGFALSSVSEPARLSAVAATPNLFDVLKVPATLGGEFGAPETAAGEHRVVVLSDGVWRRQFAADPGIIGRDIRLDGKNHTVIGVLPSDFPFLYVDVDVFVPLYLAPDVLANRASRTLWGLARTRPDATIAQTQGEIQSISARIANESPSTNQGWAGKVTSRHEIAIPRDARLAANTTLLAVGFVLLIACANIANLLLARGAARTRELAIRASRAPDDWPAAAPVRRRHGSRPRQRRTGHRHRVA